MIQDLTQTPDYRDFITALKQKVQAAQIKAARAVNRELIGLYWEPGRLITEKQQASGWGDAMIAAIVRMNSARVATRDVAILYHGNLPVVSSDGARLPSAA
jgi:hypothetical protein